MLRQPLADRLRRRARLVLRRLVSTPGGGGGTGKPKMLFSSHLPRSTGDVRSGYDVVASSAPSREQPAALIVVRQRDSPEAAAVNSRNAVVPRQPFVDERVVRVQQIDDAAILANACCRRTAPFPAGMPAADSGRSWDTRSGSTTTSSTRRRFSHCAAKSSTSASVARGSASIRRTSFSSVGGFVSCPRSASVEQALVGDAAPQEERQARGHFDDRVEATVRPRPACRRLTRRDPDGRAAGSPDRPASVRARIESRRRSCRRRAGRSSKNSISVCTSGSSRAGDTRAAPSSKESSSRRRALPRQACG